MVGPVEQPISEAEPNGWSLAKSAMVLPKTETPPTELTALTAWLGTVLRTATGAIRV